MLRSTTRKAVDGEGEEPGRGIHRRDGRLFEGAAEELAGARAPFGRHLGKEEAALRRPLDVKAVETDADVIGTNRGHRGEDGDLDAQAGNFLDAERREAAVALRRGLGHVADRFPKGRYRLDVADAAAELVGDAEGNKSGPLLAKGGPGGPRFGGTGAAAELVGDAEGNKGAPLAAKGAAGVPRFGRTVAASGRGDGLDRQIQERLLVFFGQHAPSVFTPRYRFEAFFADVLTVFGAGESGASPTKKISTRRELSALPRGSCQPWPSP